MVDKNESAVENPPQRVATDIEPMEEQDYHDPTSKIYKAFVKFQSEAGKISRGKGGQIGNQEYKYAPLETILEAIKKPLKDNGLAFSQKITGDTVQTTIIHESGETMPLTASFPEWALKDDGGRGSPMQRAGILHTYMRRYALLAALGLSPEDEDTDAEGEGKQKKLRDKANIIGKRLKEFDDVIELDEYWMKQGPTLDEIKEISDEAFPALEKVYKAQRSNLSDADTEGGGLDDQD